MRNALGRPARGELAELARGSVAIVLDYDGTLAPIRVDRDHVVMRPRTRHLLEEVARRYPCAVLSGRGRGDLLPRLEGVPLVRIVGNHGAEWDGRTIGYSALVRQVRGWRRLLVQQLGGLPGVEIEDKRLSLAIHLRRALDRRSAHAAIERVAQGLVGARLTPGKQVVNVLGVHAPDKAVAVERLLVELGCRHLLFLGDDDGDEMAFRSGAPGVIGVRVGWSATTRAMYYVPHQRRVDDFLELLCSLRAPRKRSPVEGRAARVEAR